jgi:2-aminoethylphosphonate-pyruvate transaminase
MNSNQHYLLLTPGPLTTSGRVKEVMMRDWCTWDREYNSINQDIRARLVALATTKADAYTAVLLQGSGTFSVEATIGSVVPSNGKLLVLCNGAYGWRMVEIARYLKIDHAFLDFTELKQPDLKEVEQLLETDRAITHVALVHCETTTGILNPIDQIGSLVKKYEKVFIVDAMSSFGGIPFDISEWEIDFLISSANKCIQGVPGFGFVIAKRQLLEKSKGQARSLSLDLYAQWEAMEGQGGKWRFTSPTHIVRAFSQALDELEEEGGPNTRCVRYTRNQRKLVEGMRKLGFQTLLPDELQSPIITTFLSPNEDWFRFDAFYAALKKRGFVIYPGKVTHFDCFRIGTIGVVNELDIERLLDCIQLTIIELSAQ